jgi:hypothetical protein
VNLTLSQGKNSSAGQENVPSGPAHSIVLRRKKAVTAADIRHAHSLGTDVRLSRATPVTPLARELAARYGVALVEQPEP